MSKKLKVLVIVGPTAAGKTSLSIKLAKKFSGEVISADSRQVYTGLDIGSGKVTTAEMDNVPHHLLDVADPMDVYSVADFKRDASTAITDISTRGNLPIIAGGTFFYVDTLLGKNSLPQVAPDEDLRSFLEELPTDLLVAELEQRDANRAAEIDKHNRRRLIRAIEIVRALGEVPPLKPTEPPYDSLSIGIAITKESLHANIETRLHERLENGMVAEVEGLLEQGVTHDRLDELGLEYRYLSRHLRGELTYEEMVTEIETKSRQFAKRQLTWLKRDESIHWFENTDTAAINTLVQNWLAN